MKRISYINIFFVLTLSSVSFCNNHTYQKTNPLADKTKTLSSLITSLNKMFFIKEMDKNTRDDLVKVLKMASSLSEQMGNDERIVKPCGAQVLNEFNEMYNQHIKTWKQTAANLKKRQPHRKKSK